MSDKNEWQIDKRTGHRFRWTISPDGLHRVKEYEAGEWQTETNQWGGTRRFRMVGGVKEYEGTIMTRYGEVTRSQLEAINKREAEKKKEPKKEPAPKESKYCPFKSGNRSLCRKDCSFWSESGCMQSSDTKGKKCPISLYICDSSCKLYVNGCSLIRREM